VLKRIFRSKREEVAGGWRTLHNEELHNSYASPNIITVIKSRNMSLVVHVACMGETINAYNRVVGKSEGRYHSEEQGVDGRIILEWILEKSCGKVWTACIFFSIGTSGWLL
jgi:hypothetical protein